jgi:hypothetical protein
MMHHVLTLRLNSSLSLSLSVIKQTYFKAMAHNRTVW